MSQITIKLPYWFLEKKNIHRINNSNELDGYIKKETSKAILFIVNPIIVVFSNLDSYLAKSGVWIPKSIIEGKVKSN